MRRKVLFGTCLIGLFAFQVHAQKPVTNWTGYLTPDQDPAPGSAARYEPGTPSNPMPLTGGCPTNDALGSASNVFTQILTEANPIAVDNAINTIVYAHRNNASTFGGHSGQLRYDVSTDGGNTWSTNQGVLNPLSGNGINGARYPNVSIYNPPGNSVATNAYLGYYAATVATTWNGTVSGVRKLDGTGNTETYNQPTATETLIPRSMVKGAPGTFWAIDNVYNGTAVTGYRVLKGVWNGSTDIVWSVNTTINPTFNIGFDGAVKTSDYAIAFDPTGTKGWVCLLTHVTPGPTTYAFYPTFYKTTNGGTSWTGPITVDLGQYPCISANIQPGNVASTAFDLDLAVDANGNPHAFVPVCNGNGAYAAFFTQWHAMVDVTISDGVWNPVIIRNVYRGRGTWGTSPNTVTLDTEPQISRTADGTKLFYAWVDADSSVLQATADQSPNLYAKAYDINTRKWTNSYNFTACNVTWNGKIMFPKMAETVLSNTGNYKLPIVFAELGTNSDPINPANFHYLDSVWFAPSDFVTTQCQAAVSVSAQDTIYGCGNVVLDAGPGAQVYAWSTGAVTQSITVTTSGTYSCGVSNNCCTGADTVVVVMVTPPTAAFTTSQAGFTSTFTNASTGPMTTFTWDFGDGSFSNLPNPVHTYTMPGSYTVCLTTTNVCGTDSVCHTVTATCPAANATWGYSNTALTATFTDLTGGTPSSWSWDFGDGNSSSLQNPSHTYATAGTYTVCLTIQDSCGTDSTCQPVSVCELPIAAFNSSATLGSVAFTDQSTGGISWSWTFGDGGTSNLQNPTHVYTANGTYQVCLTVMDSCGTDSTCQTLTVIVVSRYPEIDGDWAVFPIPTQGILRIAAGNASEGQLELRLYTPLGQLVAEKSLQHAGGALQSTLDLSGFSKGVYYLDVRSEQGRFVTKVVKE